jgi:hypothetical protein
LRLGKPIGAAFLNPFTSGLAEDFENTLFIRCADYPAFFRGLRDMKNPIYQSLTLT